MEYFIGITLALGICAGAKVVGMDRDRAFYPTMMIVVASYYVLFAVINGQEPAQVILQSAIATAFSAAAVVGFKRSPWWVVAALSAHTLLDLGHLGLGLGSGEPHSWPGFCLAYDATAAAFLAFRLQRTQPAAAQ